MLIVGAPALQGAAGPGILKAATALAEKLQSKEDGDEDWKVFNVLHRVASQVRCARRKKKEYKMIERKEMNEKRKINE